jgi:hypothetical protein
MPEPSDRPKSLKSPVERAARLALVDEPHVAPLNDYVRRIRQGVGPVMQVPFFDPLDGGIAAKCLYLLEAPGARAVTSGFISRNNPDESAKNFFELNREAGIPRTATVIWNIAPWYIGSSQRIRAAQKGDLAAGLPYLLELLQLLPALRIVVLMGQKPTSAEGTIRAARPDLDIVQSPHPSPLYVNHHPSNRQNILWVLQSVSSNLSVERARSRTN